MRTMANLPLSPKWPGNPSAMATAARIESIENAMSASVIEVTVPQKLRSHRQSVAAADRHPREQPVLADKSEKATDKASSRHREPCRSRT